MTASILYDISVLFRCVINKTFKVKNLQQVSNTSLYSKDARSRQVGAESPRCDLHASVCRCPNDLDLLVQSPHSQSCLIILLASGQPLPFTVAIVSGDVDVPAVNVAVVPLGLNDVVVCDQHAADNGEDNQEDAGASVASGGGRCPLAGEERRAVVVGEGHGHGVRHAAGGRGGPHVHA